jgi:hypothetical protein
LKKTVAIFFLSCLFLNITGYYLVFRFQQSEIRTEMRKKLRIDNAAEIKQFVFSLNDKKALASIEWEGDDECSIAGEMHDVISKQVIDGRLIIRCVDDKGETALIKRYNDLSNSSDPSKSRSATLLKLLENFYDRHYSFESEFTTSISNTNFDLRVSQTIRGRNDVLTPPPQIG